MKRLDHYWNSTNFVSLLLLPLSYLFCFIGKVRASLYRIKFFKSYKAPVPVIVVGNITVGGTGKTPLIIELVKQLQSMGRKPGVISRGYAGSSSSWPQLVEKDITAIQLGDEPKLIHERTTCPVSVGPNRQQDIELLLSNHHCDVILSDDGLQHYALQRDIEIVVVDAQRKFGNGFCLPAGPLRERQSRLQQVDLVLLNGGEASEYSFDLLAEFCEPINKVSVEAKTLSEFAGKTVHAIAGIGHPPRFFNMLRALDIQVIEHEFVDHASYEQSDLLFNDDLPVLMTEKDAVKCADFNLLNHWAVPVNAVVSKSAQKKLDQLFQSI